MTPTFADTAQSTDPVSRAAATPPAVAYLVSRFPRLTETFVLREIMELERRGRPVLVFPLLSVLQPVRHTENSSVADRVRYTPYLSFEVLAANLHYLVHSPRRYLATFFRVFWGNRGSLHLWLRGLALFPKSACIARRIAASRAEHVHAHFATHPALAAMIVSDLTGIGFSFTAHAHDIFVHKSMLREKIDRARFVIAISEFNKSYLLRLLPGIPERKIHVVRCGVDPREYAPRPTLAGAGRQVLRMLCVAGLEPYKGIEHLIRACALLRPSIPEFECRIIGEGRERAKLQALIRGLQLERAVCLAGPRRQDEVAEELSRTDLFVLPSVIARDGQMEGIPVALMEAMASGIPVVASRISGIPELIDDGVSGLLVPPGDEIALAQAISRLCLDQALREQFGLLGKEKVSSTFRLNENVARLDSLFPAAAEPGNPAVFAGGADISPGLVEGIRQALLARRAEAGAARGQVTLEPLHHGADSVVTRIRVAGRYPGLVLKELCPRQAPERAARCARREYIILAHVALALSNRSPHFGVPEVLAFFPERSALLMTECPGRNFGRRLRWTPLLRHGGGMAEILNGAAASGEWLGNFHEATRRHAAEDPDLVNQIERAFRKDLQACTELGLDDGIASRAVECFTRGLRAAAAGDPEWTGHHGDFGPHNVFLSPGRTMVIDFEGFRTGLPAEDLADFLVLIDLLPFYHAGDSLRRSIRRAFLDGYGRQRPLKPESIGLFELQALVKRMAHNPHLGQSGLKRERLLRSYRRRFEVLLP